MICSSISINFVDDCCEFAFGQYDQIRRNFATLVKFYKSMAIFERLCTRQNSKPTLANSVGYWVNFNCCKWPNREQTI